MKKWLKIVLITIGSLGFLFLSVMLLGNYGHTKDADYDNPPVFVTHDFIDLSKIDTISKFRSGVGHDYSGNGETCRSMRHYFGNSSQSSKFERGSDKTKVLGVKPDPAHAIEVYAPADGLIVSISGEDTPIGKQIEIVPKNGQGWHIRLDHAYPADGIHIFSKIKAGQVIALAHEDQTVDMTVLYNYRGKPRLTSYFLVMTDEVFAGYQARGVLNRSDMIIPKEVVDANPWKCAGGHADTPSFAENYSDSIEGDALNNMHLSGWVDKSSYKESDKTKNSIVDFDTCAKVYPVQESYPERCVTPEGKSYTKKY